MIEEGTNRRRIYSPPLASSPGPPPADVQCSGRRIPGARTALALSPDFVLHTGGDSAEVLRVLLALASFSRTLSIRSPWAVVTTIRATILPKTGCMILRTIVFCFSVDVYAHQILRALSPLWASICTPVHMLPTAQRNLHPSLSLPSATTDAARES
ncbi:uncharacterized protein LAESUDRAFT_398007 [Laetiporus sulphureus 93-53]|uniref:Uncharacterized protein n=1 Tax=Laetiporus sulphureus 93-53 TaxID=1314785 RepID=A0A165CF55_9APHY|nr:uncharacterized protein LAESUDRAFT_398007 [Laetiporus sulphureus 93-53]KZT02703.1 hypothetical protein LAESUDRAFT_398007 [Laetiporus sulphureus 93-53]